jgi:hypothetical protein
MNHPTSITVGTRIFELYDDRDSNVLVYHEDSHTDTKRNILEIIRTGPRKNGVFYGVRRFKYRFTEDLEVQNEDGSTSLAPCTTEIASNLPVGAANLGLVAGRIEENIQDIAAFAANETMLPGITTGAF